MGTFDPHAHRSELKLLERGRNRELYENRDGVQCPVCTRPFERVLATTNQSRQLAPDDDVELCVLRGRAELFFFTHR
jgi:uncharacterized protein (DUF2225 family)